MKAWMLLMFLILTGCTVSTGVYLEKDFQTDPAFAKPDMRTKFKIETTKQFGE